MKCSVCDNEKNTSLCPYCGFDESCNYDYLDTFALVAEGTKSLPGRIKEMYKLIANGAGYTNKVIIAKPKNDIKHVPRQSAHNTGVRAKEMKSIKTALLVSAAALAVIITVLAIVNLLFRNTVDAEDLSNPVYGEEVDNIYKFGSYEQDNDTSNGKEDIEWIVLAKENGRALIISKYALDCKKYNEQFTSVTWETCDLRKWLNEDFYNAAFSSSEQSKIQTSTVTADKNPDYDTPPGNDTQDKIFLLSINEANKYFSDEEARMCVPTAYAKEHGVYTDSDYKTSSGEETCDWLLRTPGDYSGKACYVHYHGFVFSDGYYVYINYGIRPALWINL